MSAESKEPEILPFFRICDRQMNLLPTLKVQEEDDIFQQQLFQLGSHSLPPLQHPWPTFDGSEWKRARDQEDQEMSQNEDPNVPKRQKKEGASDVACNDTDVAMEL